MEEHKLDRSAIKALASDTRVDILKSLKRRRKLPSELSRVLDLAPSTVVGHLKVLEEAELVKKRPQGPKWIYYELTSKGENVVEPETPFRFMLTFLVGMGMAFLGGIQMLTVRSFSAAMRTEMLAEKAVGDVGAAPAAAETGFLYLDTLFAGLMITGVTLMVLSFLVFRKK